MAPRKGLLRPRALGSVLDIRAGRPSLKLNAHLVTLLPNNPTLPEVRGLPDQVQSEPERQIMDVGDFQLCAGL